MSEGTETKATDAVAGPVDPLVIRDDWDNLIPRNLETANRFGRKALVMSEMAVRHVVLETLKLHGLK